MDWSVKVTDIATVSATLFSPFLAVQAQKWIERGREQTQRRVSVFRVLMSTRTAMLSPAHVEALNAIPIEFRGTKGSLKEINNAWKAYLDHLSQQNVTTEVWGQKRVDLFNELLLKISQFLRYPFTALELKRDVYIPNSHVQLQTEQDIIRQGLARLFRGDIALPMDVKSFPSDPALIESQVELQRSLQSWLAGDRSVKVTTAQMPPAPN